MRQIAEYYLDSPLQDVLLPAGARIRSVQWVEGYTCLVVEEDITPLGRENRRFFCIESYCTLPVSLDGQTKFLYLGTAKKPKVVETDIDVLCHVYEQVRNTGRNENNE